jgi:hypothetical protein
LHRSYDARDSVAGVASSTIRQHRVALDSTLAACGAQPDTAARATAEDLATWDCRARMHRVSLVRRQSP